MPLRICLSHASLNQNELTITYKLYINHWTWRQMLDSRHTMHDWIVLGAGALPYLYSSFTLISLIIVYINQGWLPLSWHYFVYLRVKFGQIYDIWWLWSCHELSLMALLSLFSSLFQWSVWFHAAHWLAAMRSMRLGPVLAKLATIIAFSRSSNACFSSCYSAWSRPISCSSLCSSCWASRSYL